jgi:aryl-alcohol dehydrogenase-like predicted oxidoreductase
LIDTALAYGNGHSERLIGQLLRQRKESIFVATKIPPRNLRWPAHGLAHEAFPASHIVESAEASLGNLGIERIDLMQLHVWHPNWLSSAEWYDALCDLREQGKIAHFGVSVNDHQPESALDLVRSGKVDTVQVIYNIFEQAPEDQLFPLCREKNVGVIARVPFDEGALTGGITPTTRLPKKDWRNIYFKANRKELVYQRIQKLQTLLGEEAPTLPLLALKFCLHHPAVSTVIPGMRSAEHAIENTSVCDSASLSSAMIAKLRPHRWEKNFYP